MGKYEDELKKKQDELTMEQRLQEEKHAHSTKITTLTGEKDAQREQDLKEVSEKHEADVAAAIEQNRLAMENLEKDLEKQKKEITKLTDELTGEKQTKEN